MYSLLVIDAGGECITALGLQAHQVIGLTTTHTNTSNDGIRVIKCLGARLGNAFVYAVVILKVAPKNTGLGRETVCVTDRLCGQAKTGPHFSIAYPELTGGIIPVTSRRIDARSRRFELSFCGFIGIGEAASIAIGVV